MTDIRDPERRGLGVESAKPSAQSRKPSARSRALARRWMALLFTVLILAFLLRRIPFDRLLTVLSDANYATFLAFMIPNTLFYFCWDTLVLVVAVTWFHGRVRYSDLLPVRASSYVVAFFNTNAGRGALAAYLSRRLGVPFLQIGGTVLFLVLTEYTHLVAWATAGILLVRSEVAAQLLWAPLVVAVFWLVFFLYGRASAVLRRTGRDRDRTGLAGWFSAPREWALFRTFRLAPASCYVEIVLLRAPMFFASLCFHYLAAPSFGIEIPFVSMLAFLPVIFMVAALPITVAHLGTTQAAWLFFFGSYAPAEKLLAFSLAAHLTFMTTRTLLGVAFLPRAWADLMGRRPAAPSSPLSRCAPDGSGR